MSNESMAEAKSTQQSRKGVWKNLKLFFAIFSQWLAAFFQLTEAEREEAGIHIEHQGGE